MKQVFGIRFPADLDQQRRSRLEFAFRVACGWHDRSVAILEPAESPDFPFLEYGTDLPALYAPLLSTPRSRLIHGTDETGRADWLGELFSWISGEAERFQPCDKWGRRGYQGSHQEKIGLDPFEAPAMAAGSRLFPQVPLPDVRLVAPTHDVDFLPTGLPSVLARGIKNALILLRFKDVQGAAEVTLRTMSALLGYKPFVPLTEWAGREIANGFRGSYYFLAGGSHPKDGNYSVERAVAEAEELERLGAEVGIHGSWQSLETEDGLRAEYAYLPRSTGGRQHYLRYGGTSRLARRLEEAGALYDSTAGWSDHPGFRHGATLPFPVYDLDAEQTTNIVEIPLAVMDVTLGSKDGFRAFQGKYPSAFAVLWHDTVLSGMQHPRRAARHFWELHEATKESHRWLRACEISQVFRERFQASGALPGDL